MHRLIGKKISGLCVNEDQSILIFDHPDGSSTAYQTWGDCCSETWFADITGVKSLLGGTVSYVEKMDLAEVIDGRTRQEYDQFYGVKLHTDKGYADIVFRNSSNGYYGGDIYLCDETPRGLFITITDDWQA